MEKIDYKKKYKDLYLPKDKPALVEVPSMNFIAVDGCGSPYGDEYQKAIQTLYALSFTIKMSKMSGKQPAGYFEYVVPPLEGLWHVEGKFDGSLGLENAKWKSMIRQLEFVDANIFDWAVNEVKNKKTEVDATKAKYFTFEEGLCVQMMHIGPYSEEQKSIDLLHAFIERNNLLLDMNDNRRHHEIYLSDPRKTKPENLKTVLRLPVKRI